MARGIPLAGRHADAKGRYYNRGYVYVYAPNHPAATKRDRVVLEHRLIAEQKIGRCLRPDEVVHHVNHVQDDNRSENLVVLTRGEHSRLHSPSIPPDVDKSAAGRKGAAVRWGRAKKEG